MFFNCNCNDKGIVIVCAVNILLWSSETHNEKNITGVTFWVEEKASMQGIIHRPKYNNHGEDMQALAPRLRLDESGGFVRFV